MCIIKNYTCVKNKWFDSEPIENEEAVKIFTVIMRQYRRGLRDRIPELIQL